MSAPAAGGAGIDLDPGLVVRAPSQLRRELGVAAKVEHLLDLELVDR
jgi:hypothetical protein